MIKMEKLKILGNEELGKIFKPNELEYSKTKGIVISPVHGRSIAVKVDKYKWILVKGGGWNYTGPLVYTSKKDKELVFGLYPLVSAEREIAVSREIEKISNNFPKVLYYKKFSDYDLNEKFDFLKKLYFKNGNLVNPCLLYTMVKSPYRVADLAYLTAEEKNEVISSCCEYWGISKTEFIYKFIDELSKNVSILHKNKFINDTLDYSNVTLLGEIVDYEWVTAPNIELLDGTMGLELTDARREKEIIYGVEVCIQLSALLHLDYNFYTIYHQFIDIYNIYNADFVAQSSDIKQISEGESFII